MMKMTKSFSEMVILPTFEERLEYLRLRGVVANETFAFERYLNQTFYRSADWRRVRDRVIIRDGGCDLGVEGFQLHDRVLIHHINPITIEQIKEGDPIVFDMENLVCVSHETHNAIHYGSEPMRSKVPIERLPNDTRLW